MSQVLKIIPIEGPVAVVIPGTETKTITLPTAFVSEVEHQKLKEENMRLREGLRRALRWIEIDPDDKTPEDWHDYAVAKAVFSE